ncbi:DoxX family protein [Flavobacterium gawalongense]|uniref:DoxX family protein n=1 Tax=Flavobacterium gawalongense TaxID=2594432 RepID=A0A553BYI7_9FLAO|nr:DoxX family protein [Flavobacterium gawalongense]TRX01130.1 DoxX family protein [Flavobacterium gawalongense]TRX05633.1 DoxX family protein [Flavobacterium gawalongense]TRX13294.1 DoxX family protein [Flavobacterium gawalongense]TRX15774.1 DoxX family protein [Flavobacterium gawalongense]TRX31612.1 DoxX family protein [Flavobacterium gawalongense]
MKTTILSWVLRITVAVILSQTLYFKFTAAEESIYIFTALGVEPYGRIGTGILELITVILILIPRTTLFGALLGCGIMVGAIFSHLFVLGIEIENDGGTLFALANIILFSCLTLIFLNKDKIPNLLKLKL